MIDLQTVKFIGFLNDLAEKSKDGIRPFSVATAQDRKGLFYDDHNPITVFPDRSYPLVNDCFIDELHHDIISTWTREYAADGIKIDVYVDERSTYVSVTSYDDNLSIEDNLHIIVGHGVWYNVL